MITEIIKSKLKDYFIIAAIFIMSIFILVKYISNTKILQNINTEKEIMINKIENYQFDNFLQNNIIGTKIEFNSFFYLNYKKAFNHIANKKILIIVDVASCQPCYKNTISYYKNFIRTYNLSGIVDLYLIVQTKNKKYADMIYNDFNDIPIFLDTKFYFNKNLNIPLSKSFITVLNDENICIFSYLIDRDEPNKDAAKSQIILRLFSNI